MLQSPDQSPFLFVTCQVGAEPALKKELLRVVPEYKFAFSRPGFVTFKNPAGKISPELELNSVFARSYGVSLGKLSVESPAWIAEIDHALSGISEAFHLHFWQRDQFLPGDEPLSYQHDQWAMPHREAFKEQTQTKLHAPDAHLSSGQLVLDIVMVEEKEAWIGFHRHSAFHPPFKQGKFNIEVPKDAPSRAYLKLEEAIQWVGAPISSGDIAVEVGSAPGGASYALLARGLQVVGIDPGEMHPVCMKNPKFSHIQRPVANVLREELPARVDWLLLDMNVEPRISLYSIDRLASRMTESLLGVFLTVKLNQWSFADQIPNWVEHVQAMGMVRAKAKQLSSNRQEIMIYGLTQKGVRRQSMVRSSAK